jgi:hypothetical protein
MALGEATGSSGTRRADSRAGAQPSQNNRDETADRGLGRQAAGGSERVETIARELVRGHVGPNVAGLRGLRQWVLDQAAELLLRSVNVLAPRETR